MNRLIDTLTKSELQQLLSFLGRCEWSAREIERELGALFIEEQTGKKFKMTEIE
jgi:hypothetical protein